MPIDRTISTSAFPLKISANRRFLVDQSGRPFLIHGDTAWSMITAITKEQAEHYLSNRAAKGFNAIIVNLVEHFWNGPRTRSGEHPFNDSQDVSTMNDRYFEHADWVLKRAEDYGIVVFLAPLYLGYRDPGNNEGWIHETRLSGTYKCWQYGQYLGQRYKNFNNIIWMMGGDRNSDGVIDEVNSLVQGIKAFNPQAMFTAHPHPETVTVEQYGGSNNGGWLDINTTYTYQIVHSYLLADYNRRPIMPFVLIESTYEGEHNSSAVQIRRQAYWANLCGASGQFIGNRPIFLFDTGWEQAMELEGSRSMMHLKTFFTSREWYKLVPDQIHQVVTRGWGEARGCNTLTAALTSDGDTLMAYMPGQREITVDLSRVSGSRVRFCWFDPSTGISRLEGEFPATEVRKFLPPGEGDWAFIVDNAEKNYPVPGE